MLALFWDFHSRLVILFLEDWIRPEVEISKCAPLSLNDNNLSNTEAIVTK